jgi:hypothetical protein
MIVPKARRMGDEFEWQKNEVALREINSSKKIRGKKKYVDDFNFWKVSKAESQFR